MNSIPITFKHEISTDLVACRACLCTDRKLFSVHNTKLLFAYSSLTGIEVSPYDLLPQYLCNYCSALLTKFSTFKDHCHKAKSFLEQAKQTNQDINSEYLNKFPKIGHYTIKSLVINVNSTLFKSSTLKQRLLTAKDGKRPVIRTDDNSETDDDNDLNNDNGININNDNGNDINNDNGINDIDDNDHDYKSSSSYDEDDKKELKIFAQSIKIELDDDDDDEKPLINLSKIKKKVLKKPKKGPIIRRPKYFENKQNMRDFEKAWDVDIIILSRDQQMKEVLDRKMGQNYLHSPYKCELCYKGFMDQDILDRHTLHQHDPSKVSVCEFCKYRYKNPRDLKQHVRNLHRLKFSCRQCSNVTKFVFKAKEHYKKQHGGEKYQCQHCGKTYQKLSSHLSHLRIHHPSEFLWCELCGEAFLGEKGLNTHNHKTHRHLSLPHQCSCNKSFATEDAFSRHSQYNNCGLKFCAHCGEGFSVPLELRDHLLQTHKKDKLFTCEKCNKNFNSEVTYCGHYRRFHVEEAALAICKRRPRVPWVCELCGKELASIQGFTVHMRIHNRERPFKCSICPKTYAQQTLLQIHMRTHTGERPYECQLCPKTFNNKPALNRHNRVHTGIKPYECPQCGKAFTQSNSMKLHVNTVHLKMPAPYKSRARRHRDKLIGKDDITHHGPEMVHDSTLTEPDVDDTSNDLYDKYKKKKLYSKT